MSGGAQDTAELVVATHGDVYIAAKGTSLPAEADDALSASWYKLGLINEDGATISAGPEIEEFRAWQRRQPVRRELTGQEITVAFALEQWNAETVKFAYGGGDAVDLGGGQFRYDFPSDSDSIDERAIVLDWQDGTKSFRVAFEAGNVSEAVETQLARGSLAILPITFAVNSPAAGGSPGSFYASDADFHS